MFDDAAVMASGVLGTLSGLRREARDMVRHQMDRLLSEMDLVTRDEFNAFREMAVNTQDGQGEITGRIAGLEDRLNETVNAGPEISALRHELDAIRKSAEQLAVRQGELEERISRLETDAG